MAPTLAPGPNWHAAARNDRKARAVRSQGRRRYRARHARGAPAHARDLSCAPDPRDGLRLDGPGPLGARDPPDRDQAGLPEEDAQDEGGLTVRTEDDPLRNPAPRAEDRGAQRRPLPA